MNEDRPFIGQYTLVGQTPVPCHDSLEWAVWFEKAANRRVGFTRVGPYEISTIFLGLDHNFLRFMNPNEPPILFETMVFVEGIKPHENCDCFHCRFTREAEDYQTRCSTWLQAEAMHAQAVAEFTSRCREAGDTSEPVDLT